MKRPRVAHWLHRSGPGGPKPQMGAQVVQDAMRETNQSQDSRPEDIIAAFDRQAQLAQELNRRHTEHVRSSRSDDRPIRVERRRRPR